MKKDPNDLPERWRRIVARVAVGEEWSAAAKAEGCSEPYSRVIHTRMKKHPTVAKAIQEIQAEGRKLAVYDLATAMKEAEEVITFAKGTKNAMAYFKAVEHRARLSGLLVDEFWIHHETLVLRPTLGTARSRVILTACPKCHGPLICANGCGPRVIEAAATVTQPPQ